MGGFGLAPGGGSQRREFTALQRLPSSAKEQVRGLQGADWPGRRAASAGSPIALRLPPEMKPSTGQAWRLSGERVQTRGKRQALAVSK